MVYVDTNILVYIVANQGKEKREAAIKIVRELIDKEDFLLSPLTMQEFIYTLAKLNIDWEQVSDDIDFYMDYIRHNIDKDIIKDAYALCKEMNYCKNINDAIHLKFAEKYCRKVITFDTDFKKFLGKTSIEIEILKYKDR
jgi:predicted nucleic acid-binding protein